MTALLLGATILIHATLPATAEKASVADKLREAAKKAGCEQPVVEMELSEPEAPLRMRVWCRDEPAPPKEPAR